MVSDSAKEEPVMQGGMQARPGESEKVPLAAILKPGNFRKLNQKNHVFIVLIAFCTP